MTPGIFDADELLTTTRAVRRGLDLSRPVDLKLVEECVSVAQQAPSASNRQDWHFVLVIDETLRKELGKLFKKSAEMYLSQRGSLRSGLSTDPLHLRMERNASKIRSSVTYLIDHIAEVPVHVIPCLQGRTDGLPAARQAARWASIIPAAWSFMLAARARGLGTTFTTFHLAYEEEAARILGIPYAEVMQAMLLPVAYVKTSKSFKPAPREPLGSMLHVNHW